jgi:phage gp36-like protein
VTVYASLDDLGSYGLSPALYEGSAEITPARLTTMLSARSAYADDYLGRFYALPMVTVSQSVTIAVCQLVAWDAMRILGHNPDEQGTSQWRDGRDEALATLERIAKYGSPGCTDSTPEVEESGIAAYSEPRRGW